LALSFSYDYIFLSLRSSYNYYYNLEIAQDYALSHNGVCDNSSSIHPHPVMQNQSIQQILQSRKTATAGVQIDKLSPDVLTGSPSDPAKAFKCRLEKGIGKSGVHPAVT
jgi:hypothetical protein